MKIGLLSWILDRQRTGIDNYLYNIVQEMVKANESRDISLIHFQRSNDEIYQKVNDVIIDSFPYNIINPFKLSKSLKELQIDIFHLPSHMVPQISPFFINPQVKKVLTVHDLIPLIFHKNLPYFYKLWIPTLKLIKNRPDCIITDSMNTRNDLINYLNIPEDKIKVIPLAPNSDFKFMSNKSTINDEIKVKYNISSPFILYVGTVEQRKNIFLLIKSFYKLLKKGNQYKLVLIGIPGHGFKEISKTVKLLGISKNVIFLGYVPHDDLIKFYNAADLFVFPSLYEGFGLPPLEAMACGSPVIASNTSSLPEVIGDAGVLLAPDDEDGFTENMYQILTNEDMKTEMRKRSLKRAKMFSWEKTANKTWEVYEEVLSTP
jgi:glycosyltransferase involved in cell wall biosynthesis